MLGREDTRRMAEQVERMVEVTAWSQLSAVAAALGCVAVSSMQDVAHMVGEVSVLPGSG